MRGGSCVENKPMQSPEDFNEELTNRNSHVARINGSKMVLHTHSVVSNSGALCALLIFDPLQRRSAIKLSLKWS